MRFECMGCRAFYPPEMMYHRGTAQVRGGTVSNWPSKADDDWDVDVVMLDQLCKSCEKKNQAAKKEGKPLPFPRRPVNRGNGND